MQRDRQYWLPLAKLTTVGLTTGLAMGLVGHWLLSSTLYTHTFTPPIHNGLTHRNSISPIRIIRQISPHHPLLIYDKHEVESDHAYEQYKAAGEPQVLWIVPNCGHDGYLHAAPEEWERRVVSFFDGAFR